MSGTGSEYLVLVGESTSDIAHEVEPVWTHEAQHTVCWRVPLVGRRRTPRRKRDVGVCWLARTPLVKLHVSLTLPNYQSRRQESSQTIPSSSLTSSAVFDLFFRKSRDGQYRVEELQGAPCPSASTRRAPHDSCVPPDARGRWCVKWYVHPRGHRQRAVVRPSEDISGNKGQ